ncbi:MAG: hypothetical protein CMG67_03320 [Candidatus Marinimicrobia bacterium]|nr:hypothetical protein [Candidatus Neomarinimicrobiota bacterium]|tara:strand:- start:4916 stop:6544 length:1629 start_codon:yes stop_codon:yes gene_type:complete
MIKFIFVIFYSFLFSSNIIISNEQKLNESKLQLQILNDKLFFSDVKDLKLFDINNYKYKIQNFEAPFKLTSTTLRPLSREMSLNESAHLLRRTIIGPTIEEVNSISTISINDAVEYILRDISNPGPPGDWVNYPIPVYQDYTQEQIDSLLISWQNQQIELGEWWIDNIFYNSTNITELMTLFWHDHFATSAETIIYPPAMYHQNRVLRENSLGNFKDLITLMTFDPAMMIWLNNNENSVGSINENFSRELLELFTLGEGNYTEQDVTEAARALTGYFTDGLNIYFAPSLFDDGEKTFLGRTGYFDAYDIIDIIFLQPETAYFISEKLYKYFIYENPNEEIVQQLADIMVENNYEIKPVISALLNSEHFFDENFYGSKYKDPVTHSVGILRQLYIDVNQDINYPYTLHQILAYVQSLGGQRIFYPPDVSGWPGYRNWVNTYTLPWRKLYTNYILNGGFGIIIDPISFAERIPNGLSDSNALLDYLYIYFYSIEPSQLTKQNLMDELLAGADPGEWHLIYYDGATERFMDVVQRMMRLSEYQLK